MQFIRRSVASVSKNLFLRFSTAPSACQRGFSTAAPSACQLKEAARRPWVRPLFWASVATSQVGLLYMFRDLADLSQWILEPPRASTMASWRSRNVLSAVSLLPLGAAAALKGLYPWVVSGRALAVLAGWSGLLYYSSAINPHLMMRARGRAEDAVFVPQEEALSKLPRGVAEPCVILEVDGKAVAYPDSQVLRPHVAHGGDAGGDSVVLTYCGLSNLGIAYTPELGGERLDLHPMTQLQNNLVMYDRNSMEPVQQLWGTTEDRVESHGDLATVERMREWPTYRLTLGNFCQAWPGSKVFMNDYSTPGLRATFRQNPIVYAYDRMMDTIFSRAIVEQATKEEPVFPTLHHYDSRLANKEEVYVVPLSGDAVAYTEAFLQKEKLVNATVGGRKVVLAYFPDFSAIGAFYNTTGGPIKQVDFYGRVAGTNVQLPRVETLRAGVYWCVWVNWFPQTDLNRTE